MQQVFWIELAEPSPANGTGIGVGVTAFDIDDAEVHLNDAFGSCEIASERVIKSINEIEQNHVRPNMGELPRSRILVSELFGLVND